MSKPSIVAREAAQLAPEYITAITGREPERMTSLGPSDEGGWIVEAEMVDDRRIPRSTDMLALYAIELDADGELLACSRTRRYRRGEALSPMTDREQTPNGDTNGVWPE
jgi:gas vesicle protein GvpO